MDKFATAFHESAHAIVAMLALRLHPAKMTIRTDRARNSNGHSAFRSWEVAGGGDPPGRGPGVSERAYRQGVRLFRRRDERLVLIALAGPAQDTQRDDDWGAGDNWAGTDLAFFYSETGDVRSAHEYLIGWEPDDRRRDEWLNRLSLRVDRLLRRRRIFRAVEQLAVTLYRRKTLAGNDLERALARAERTVGWPWSARARPVRRPGQFRTQVAGGPP